MTSDWFSYCYLLKCADGTYYVRHTDNMEKRFAELQLGAFPGYTYKRRPVELTWSDMFQTREDAKTAEKQIKGRSRTKKEALMRDDWDRVSELARCRSRNP